MNSEIILDDLLDAEEQLGKESGIKVNVNTDELHTIELAKKSAEVDKLKEEIENLKQNRSQRKKFAYWIFGFMCLYIIAVFAVLFFTGFRQGNFCLADSVLLMLLGTTTANVIGIFVIVAKYLFHIKE